MAHVCQQASKEALLNFQSDRSVSLVTSNIGEVVKADLLSSPHSSSYGRREWGMDVGREKEKGLINQNVLAGTRLF